MIVGVPREVKDNEFRVALTPEGVRELIAEGHRVLVESGAGVGSAIADEDFRRAGASDRRACRCGLRRGGHDREGQGTATRGVRALPQRADRCSRTCTWPRTKGSRASWPIARCERSRTRPCRPPDGRLPLLAPMSEIAGRMAPQEGAAALERPHGGRGVLMGGASGVAPAKVVVLGGGMAGANAAQIAAGMEAEVTVVDRAIDRLRDIDRVWHGRIQTVMSSALAIERLVVGADLVVGAVLVPGAKAPHLVDGRTRRADAARLGAGRHLDRSGWLLRDVARHHPFRTHVRRGRRRPLLRRQHARCRPANLDVRAHQRHRALRDRDRGSRSGGGDPRRSRARARRQRLRRPDHERTASPRPTGRWSVPLAELADGLS